MNEPSEEWLDRHFKQQLMEYDEEFNRSACKSDQHIINYWLEIFEEAPKSEKWARNGLMLLMYGHLKELGYLQVPFTDMRNVGRNLNDILNSYTGLPVINRHKSTQIESPVCKRNTKRDLIESAPNENPLIIQSCSASTIGSLPITSSASSSLKSQELNPKEKPTYTMFRNGNRSASSADSIIPETRRMLYDTFDSHECYKEQATDRTSCELEHSDAESKIMSDMDTVFESVIDVDKLNRTPLSQKEDYVPEMGVNVEQDEMLNKSSSISSGKSCIIEDTSSPNSAKKTEGKKKYKTKRELNQQRFRRCSSEHSASSKLDDVEIEESPAERAILDAEIFELRKRNKELRRQCLMYYTKSGKFRKEIRLPKVRDLGFRVGAYRAQLHFTRWTNLRQRQLYFRQQFDGGHNWRSYRRVLLHSGVPRWRMQEAIDKKRQLILLRMSYVLRLKQIYPQVATCHLLSAQEMLTLLATLETKYLSLAKDLHSKLHQFIK